MIKKIKFKKESIFTLLFVIFCAIILALTVKGLPGNPTAEDLNSSQWTQNGPFETSNDRGRFALLYSVVENKSLFLSQQLAEFSTPDLAVREDGKYVSLFAPGVAFVMIPGYITGKYFGSAQAGVFFMMSFFALLNVVLLRAIAIRLGASRIAATIGAFTFIFATPAFSYATTLYQHHLSTFIVLVGLYSLLRWNNFWSLALIWLLFAFSGAVDNPNYLIMFPIAVSALARIIAVKLDEKKINVKFKLVGVLAMFAVLIPISFFMWFNKNSNGSPFLLSGSLERVVTINKTPVSAADLEKVLEASKQEESTAEDKNPVSFFKTRNLLNGFYIHFLSPDRGLVHYTPVMIFGFLGIALLFRKRSDMANIIAAMIGLTVILYSMWGDPYGGWSFGSRYLVPVYALLSLGVAFFLTEFRQRYIVLILFIAVFINSVQINTLGAVTTNTNPPQIEVLALEKISGTVQKYTEERNWQYLQEKGSKSFVFQTALKERLPAEKFYWIIFYLIISVFFILTYFLVFLNKKEKP